ncbi:hypothetical protein [Streptomyces sp. NPDC001508]|uniref:hypothetical protein n=1 Tax=Streptomyces sp. NPDC001508 TaxID=3154656 RepID=UPI003320B9E1
MQSRGHTLKLTAVSVLVILSLTGFSTGRHGRGHHHSDSDSDGGGGCSSSSQDHDTSSSSSGGSGSYRDRYDDDDTYDSDDGYGSGGTSTGTTAPAPTSADATVKLLRCASKKAPYATVEVENPHGTPGTFAVTVDFENARGKRIASEVEEVDVSAYDTVTVNVYVAGSALAARVGRCDPHPTAPPVG